MSSSTVDSDAIQSPVVAAQVCNPQFAEIVFLTGERVNIPMEWREAYPLFQGEYVRREYDKFRKYVLPTLCGASLKCESVDTRLELGEIISELRAYGITLTQKQILDVSISSGFLNKMDDIREFIIDQEACGRCCPRSYKRRRDRFKKVWDEYIALVAEREQDGKYLQVDFSSLYSMLRQKTHNVIPDANVRYDNLIFEFFCWFEQFVLKGQTSGFMTYLVDMKNSITSPQLLSSIPQIRNVVEGLVQSVPMNKEVAAGIHNVMLGLENMSNMLAPPPAASAVGTVNPLALISSIPDPPPPSLRAIVPRAPPPSASAGI